MRLVGMMPVFNESDIIEEVIEHLLSQGVNLVVLDNGSTDGSYEICKKFEANNLIKLKQYKSTNFDYGLLSRILYDMALEQKPDWIIRSDQDELLESGITNTTLKDAIEKEDSKGFNLIQFDVFEFFMTDNDNEPGNSLREKLPYYSWQHDYTYRAWKHLPGTRVEDSLGHHPIFPEGFKYKIPEKKLVLRHYRFRNKQQAINNNKIRLERIRNRPETKIGQNVHFKKISEKKYFEELDHKILNKYLEDNNWNYEGKCIPYVMSGLPKREQVFSKYGELLIHYPSIFELKAEIKEKNIIKPSKGSKVTRIIQKLKKQIKNKISSSSKNKKL